jgi:hypothetical protein
MRRGGWARQGALSAAHWLSWKVGIDLGAAREKVRVARSWIFRVWPVGHVMVRRDEAREGFQLSFRTSDKAAWR